MRIVVVGATDSTLWTLQALVRHECSVVCTLSLDERLPGIVSGLATREIEEFCDTYSIEFSRFADINGDQCIEQILDLKPDVLFAVGFSQIVGDKVLSIPTHGTVGFHPTLLPKGRGRAPLAWLTYNVDEGAATFFLMQKGVDDGPILVQEPFKVFPDDHAFEVSKKIHAAMDVAFDFLLPKIKLGELDSKPQDNEQASYTGIRKPVDGLIEWTVPIENIYAKIRAASRPHPGAYTYAGNNKVIIWKARPAGETHYQGVPGRVLEICPERGVLVQAGDGLLWLEELEWPDEPREPGKLRIGQMLGYISQNEIFELKQELAVLREYVEQLKKKQ